MKNFNLAFSDTISFHTSEFDFEECHLDEKGKAVITSKVGKSSADEEKDAMIILERMWKTNTILEVDDHIILGDTELIVDEVWISTLDDGRIDVSIVFE